MLTRRRDQILIIVGLLGLNMLLGWVLQRQWNDYRSRVQWVERLAPAAAPAAVAPAQHRAQPQSFVEIVDRNVFSPLRGSAPPQAVEEVKAPKLPSLFGTMNLGDGWFALMAAADQSSQASKRVVPGEEIGGYQLVSIGMRDVIIQWQDKMITLDITEPTHRTYDASERTTPRAAAAPNTAPARMPARPFTGPFSSSPAPNPPPVNSDAPVGTVTGGRRKVLAKTPFGTAAVWQPIGQGESPNDGNK